MDWRHSLAGSYQSYKERSTKRNFTSGNVPLPSNLRVKRFRVVSLLTGGNIDTTVLGRTIERGLAVDSRLIRLEVVVSDRPGGEWLEGPGTLR